MPGYAVRCVAVIIVGALFTSCHDTPAPTQPVTPALPSAAPIDFPSNPTPFPGPGTYVFAPTPGVQVSYAARSSYVLNDDGSFALRFPDGEYRGTYRVDTERVTFEFEGRSIAGPWVAAAAFSGDSMTVKYNLVMLLSDFEDAVYVRTR
jgi:hypothetical protein